MIAASQRPKLRDEVRIREKADVEDQISVFRHAFTKTEADAGNEKAALFGLLLKTFGDVSPQLVDVEFGRVDDQICEPANRAEVPTFGLESGFYGRIRAQGMRAASFAEAAQKHGIGGLEEHDLGRNHPPDGFQNCR